MSFHTLPLEDLARLVRLDPETGKLFWLTRPNSDFRDSKTQAASAYAKSWNTAWAGKEAGNLAVNGYRRICILHKSFPSHRVVWALAHGEWPSGAIDHINGDPADNRPSNLRIVNASENAKNCKMSEANTSGVTGVSWCKRRQKWIAGITSSGKQKKLGRFDSKEDAIAARKHAEIVHGFHPNHGRRAA